MPPGVGAWASFSELDGITALESRYSSSRITVTVYNGDAHLP